ncbi:hypothetical protein M011DRAFT_426808 [Sporormia fimetaria CBS 119925]|uniref:CENP-V/GFA domain-containing protein n=1 Tax=Sporormia fimetaria CBS 119925 TaxID=1340428 RepID=A0A6A6V8R6_9PLEO|nr:hypothetical protein M011DRAFT_426808 [Sporormia fimetaria CBS 119925]
MPPTRPFPIVHGGCTCTYIRYQLLRPPLFCYACHCVECQKSSGSAFASIATVEFDALSTLSSARPLLIPVSSSHRYKMLATCPRCRDVCWTWTNVSPATLDVRIGTLDLPNLFAPDVHIFVGAMVDWIRLPEEVGKLKGDFEWREVYPRESVVRLEMATKRWEERERRRKGEGNAAAKRNAGLEEAEHEGTKETVEEGEKTPTIGSPGPEGPDGEEDGEMDEELERRYEEMERALQERLEKLSLKLSQEEKGSEVKGNEEMVSQGKGKGPAHTVGEGQMKS